MQSASPLEEVASLVLQRNPQDADAKYVHFFHEKIPSRQLAQCTNLDALSEIISEKSTQGEPLRTRATVRTFKEDFEGAIADLTEALRIHRVYRLPQNAPKHHNHPQARPGGRKQEDVVLKELNRIGRSREDWAMYVDGGWADDYVDYVFPPGY